MIELYFVVKNFLFLIFLTLRFLWMTSFALQKKLCWIMAKKLYVCTTFNKLDAYYVSQKFAEVFKPN